MKRTIRKLTAILMALLMLASLGSVSAFAKSAGTAKAKDYKTYKTYVSFGDSVAAGVSTSTYKAAHKTKEAKTNYFVRVPGTYVDRVAKKVHTKKLYPLAQPGMRSEELRMLLCDDYSGDGHEAYVTNALNGYTTPGGKYTGSAPSTRRRSKRRTSSRSASGSTMSGSPSWRPPSNCQRPEKFPRHRN